MPKTQTKGKQKEKPRHDLKAQIKALGADSLLPPDKEKKRKTTNKKSAAPKISKQEEAKLESNISHTLNRWHHTVNQISGGLVIAIGARKVRRGDLFNWADTLRGLAVECEAMAQIGYDP